MPSESPARKPILSLDTWSLDTWSLDTWAVVLSLALALFIRLGLIKSVAW